MKHPSFSSAIIKFQKEMPEIVDYYDELRENVNNFIDWETNVYDSSAEGEPDESWNKECPEFDHDCCREGCGRTVVPDWYVTGTLSARRIGSNKREVLLEWGNNYRGGYGI